MTVPAGNARKDYEGNGTATSFSYDWRVFDKTQIEVILVTTAGAEQSLVVDTDYTVNNIGARNGGTITLNTAPASGERLVLLANYPVEQATDFRNQGRFFPENHEDQFDKITVVAKQLREALARSVKVPKSTIPGSANTDLPNPAGQPNKYVVTNQSGDGFDLSDTDPEFESYIAAAEAAANTATQKAVEASDSALSADEDADRAELAAQQAASAGYIFTNTSQGLLSTTDGQYFWVVSNNEEEILILYLNDSGIAVNTGKNDFSRLYLDNMIITLQQLINDGSTTLNGIVSSGETTLGQYVLDGEAARDAAQLAEQGAEESFLDVDKKYLGAFATAPTLDNQGDALQTGALYWNTTTLPFGKMFSWNGAAWVDLSPDVYVQDTQPVNAPDGSLWIETAGL